MKSSRTGLRAIALAALSLSLVPFAPAAQAAEFQIFNNLQRQAPGPFSIDLDPAAPGREHLNINFFQCTVSAPDVDGKITAQRVVRISAASADGVANVFTTAAPASATSLKFPDPRVASHFCGASGEGNYHTSYESLDTALNTNVRTMGCPAPSGHPAYGRPFSFDPNPIEFCSEFPRSYIGAGIAVKDATRVLLVGVGLKGVLERPAFEDVSNFTITAYNLNGSRRWTKVIPASYGDRRLFADWAAVGDFLGDDGNDEIRIVYPGSTYRHVFYDVLTGARIRTVDVAR